MPEVFILLTRRETGRRAVCFDGLFRSAVSAIGSFCVPDFRRFANAWGWPGRGGRAFGGPANEDPEELRGQFCGQWLPMAAANALHCRIER